MPAELRILRSPSMQKQFGRCDILGQLQYVERWELQQAHRSLVPRLRGNAIARAAEIVHKAIMQGNRDLLTQSEFLITLVDEAVALFDRQFTYCQEQGVIFPADADATSRAEIRRIVPLFARNTPVLAWQSVNAVEEPIPSYSCRPDLGGVEPTGFECVGDIKYKSALDARYRSNTIEEYHWDPQFLQYNVAWRHARSLGPDVPVYSCLILVVGHPFTIESVYWLYTPEQLQFWITGAEGLSDRINGIQDGTVQPIPATTHRDNFGWCPMFDACMKFNLDPNLMRTKYVQLRDLPE